MLRYLLAAAFSCGLSNRGIADGTPVAAPLHWECLSSLLRPSEVERSADSREAMRLREIRTREYRDAGLRHFVAHPEDTRRWEWLNQTLRDAPLYLVESEPPESRLSVDREALSAWDESYEKMRAELFTTVESSARHLRPLILYHEVLSLCRRLQHGVSTDFGAVGERIATYAARQELHDPIGVLNRYAGVLKEKRGKVELAEFITALRTSPAPIAVAWAEGQCRTAALAVEPLDLVFPSSEGGTIDLKKMRGKRVVLYGWTVWCSGCVAKLPRLAELRSQMAVSGIELVGVCFITNSLRDEERTRRIMSALTPAWHMGILKDDDAAAFLARYSVRSMPLVWQLDVDGKLTSSDMLTVEQFEAMVVPRNQ